MLVHSFHGPLLLSLERSHDHAPMSDQGIKEHRELIEAITLRDLATARQIMTRHLDRTAQRVRRSTASDS